MNTTTLHYIYDPLCGWCYGTAPLVKAAREVLSVRPHGGGMMTGARRQIVTPQLRDFVKPHDARIAQLSGQRFGENYLDGLLRDTKAVFDSEPPTASHAGRRNHRRPWAGHARPTANCALCRRVSHCRARCPD